MPGCTDRDPTQTPSDGVIGRKRDRHDDGTPGPHPRPETVHLAVGGMSCGSCAATIERALTSTPGVRAAKVDLAAGEATVEVNAVPAEVLVAAISGAGYIVWDLRRSPRRRMAPALPYTPEPPA